MEQIQKLWTGILDILSKLVIPDWGALVALLPLFVLALVALWLLMTVRGFATLGPRQRRPQFAPVPPAGLHAPGPSYAPVLGAIGTAAFVAALVVGGAALLFAVLLLVLALLYWLREFMAEYEHVAGATTLPVPLDQLFTYAVNGATSGSGPVVGARVLVPFSGQRLMGVVVRVHENAPADDFEIKPVQQVLDDTAILPAELMKLAEWIASYYVAPLGEVLRGMLPLAAEVKRHFFYRIAEAGRRVLYEGAAKGSSRRIHRAATTWTK